MYCFMYNLILSHSVLSQVVVSFAHLEDPASRVRISMCEAVLLHFATMTYMRMLAVTRMQPQEILGMHTSCLKSSRVPC